MYTGFFLGFHFLNIEAEGEDILKTVRVLFFQTSVCGFSVIPQTQQIIFAYLLSWLAPLLTCNELHIMRDTCNH